MTAPDGDGLPDRHGKVRALTAGEAAGIEGFGQFKNGDFGQHMADLSSQREMAELKSMDSLDSP